MVDTVLHPLDMTVENRGIGLDAQPVGRFVHGEPFGRRPLVGTDAGADILVEDLGTAARNRLHARFAQPSQPLFERQPRPADHVRQFDGRKGFDGRFGQNRLHAADHLDIVVEVVVGMHAPHDMHLGHPLPRMGAGDGLDLLHRVVPRLGIPLRTAVGAEPAVEDAAVRRFDMEIAVVVDLVAAHGPLAAVGQFAQQPQRRPAPQRERLGGGDAAARAHLVGDMLQFGIHYFGAFL